MTASMRDLIRIVEGIERPVAVEVEEIPTGVYVRTANGVLFAERGSDAFTIHHVEVADAARSKGEGITLYDTLIRYAGHRGLPIRSDKTVETPAVLVYAALKRKGYDVRTNPTIFDIRDEDEKVIAVAASRDGPKEFGCSPYLIKPVVSESAGHGKNVKDAYLYHATRMDNLTSIQQHGLTPNFAREPNFDGYPVNGRLYVAQTEDGAKFYAETLKREFDVKIAMLRFPVSLVKVQRDEYGNPEDHYTKNTVRPEAIEVQKGNRWVPLPSVGTNSRKRAASVGSTAPDFTIGPLSVFKVGNLLEVTCDGLPKADNNKNVVIRLVIDNDQIVDAATPRVGEFKDAVTDLLNHLGIPASGRASTALNYHGFRCENGHWTLG